MAIQRTHAGEALRRQKCRKTVGYPSPAFGPLGIKLRPFGHQTSALWASGSAAKIFLPPPTT